MSGVAKSTAGQPMSHRLATPLIVMMIDVDGVAVGQLLETAKQLQIHLGTVVTAPNPHRSSSAGRPS